MCRRPCSVSFCPFSIPRGLVPLFTMRFRCLPAMLQVSASDESGQSARKQVVFFFRDFFPSSFGVCVMMIDDCDDGSEPQSCSSLSSGLVCFYPQISTFLHTPRHGQLADNRSVTDSGMYHSEKRYFQDFFHTTANLHAISNFLCVFSSPTNTLHSHRRRRRTVSTQHALTLTINEIFSSTSTNLGFCCEETR